MTPEERADEICDKDGYAKWRHIVSAIRAACAERDRQAVEFIRGHYQFWESYKDDSNTNTVTEEVTDDALANGLADALAAYLAQNGGGK